KYAANVVRSTLKAQVQHLGLLYDRRFDVRDDANIRDSSKLEFDSPYSYALAVVKPGSRVLDLSSAGELAAELEKRGCAVVAVDVLPPDETVDVASFDYILLLDVVEHLPNPEAFVEQLGDRLKLAPNTRLIMRTGNIGFA